MPDQHVDGKSLAPLFSGKSIERDCLFWHYPHYSNQGGDPSSVITKGKWKLINYHESGRNELYDIDSDVGETKDVSADHPDVVVDLLRRLDAWLNEVDARQATPNPGYDPTKFRRQQLNILAKRTQALEKQHARFLDKDYRPSDGWWEQTGK